MSVRSLVAPWPGKSGRVLTCLGEPAYLEYASAVTGVAQRIEEGLAGCVHGGRVSRLDPLSIEDWREARVRHRRAALHLAVGATTALGVDVADCFRSIGVDQVREALSHLGTPPAAMDRVCAFLDKTRSAGIPGLPVGPDPSAVLANAVLRSLDVVAERSGAAHVRWYDDVLIFSGSIREAFQAEEEIARACREIGLRLNPGKRRIATGPAAIRRLILSGPASTGSSS